MTDLIELLLVIMWPASGVIDFLYHTQNDSLWESEHRGFMMWGLFLSFIFGPLMILGRLLND